MKIQLDYPYSVKWSSGYIVNSRDGRKTLILYNNTNKSRSSTQYARYLLAVKLGRFLTKNETVDHIDGDKTNNSVDNLQILSIGDNIRKSQKKDDYVLVCPVCKKRFIRPHSHPSVRGKIKKERLIKGELCCSRKCGGIYSHRYDGPVT